MSTQQIDPGHIAEAAFYLWLEDGQPEGRADEHWHKARLNLEAQAPKSRAKRKAAAPKVAKATKAAPKAAKTAAPKRTRKKADA